MSARNAQLDGLRGYAAVVVIFFHSFAPSVFSSPALFDARDVGNVADRLALALLNGLTAVSIFFVLSGAVLIQSLFRHTGSMAIVSSSFVVERLFRIFPALILWVLATAAFQAAVGTPQTAQEVASNLLLQDFAILGQSATLNAEIWAIPFLLLAFFVLKRAGLIAMVALCVVYLVAARHLPHGPGEFLRLFAYPFVIGILVPTALGRWIGGRLTPAALWISIPAMILGAHAFAYHLHTGFIVQETGAGVLVAMLFYGRGGALGNWLSRPHAVFLGRISYSLYLANLPAIALGNIWLRPFFQDHSLAGSLVIGAVAALATIPLAAASYRWVEQPFIRLSKHLFASTPIPAIASN